MSSTVYMNAMARRYSNDLKSYETKGSQTETTDFIDTVLEKSRESQGKSESVVDRYKREHPDQASVVDSQVQAGKAVRARYGGNHVSTEDMTMEEYKRFIDRILKSIPFDATRKYDKEMISISEAGWEQMKNDPDYEAWVLGYTAQNRSVRNPFFGWPGASGSFYVEKFGASIEEHVGQTLGRTGPGCNVSPNRKKEKSWWDKRQERMEELMAEQVERARKKAQAERKLAQENYLNSLYASQQRLRGFLMVDVLGEQDVKDMLSSRSSVQAAYAAAAVYEDSLSLLSKRIMRNSE